MFAKGKAWTTLEKKKKKKQRKRADHLDKKERGDR